MTYDRIVDASGYLPIRDPNNRWVESPDSRMGTEVMNGRRQSMTSNRQNHESGNLTSNTPTGVMG